MKISIVVPENYKKLSLTLCILNSTLYDFVNKITLLDFGTRL